MSMARPLRMNREGGWYHVFGSGLSAFERRAANEGMGTPPRSEDVARARHGDSGAAMAMWLARRCTGLTLQEIGDALGGRGYAAVGMAIRRFERRAKQDRAMGRQRREAAEMLNVKMSPQYRHVRILLAGSRMVCLRLPNPASRCPIRAARRRLQPAAGAARPSVP